MIDENNNHIAQDLYTQSYRATFDHLAGSSFLLLDMHQMKDAIQTCQNYGLTAAEIRRIRQTAFSDAKKAFETATFIEE